MAFRLRLQFPGAIYHVINRGNYRSWVFAHPKTRAAFESCLFEACARYQWLLHAFVVMSNHYHLALATPLGNLAAGMQWLQSTFANRFNRFRDERRHLFQSRYKALLVEAGDALGNVCHYIHLNPVRAGLVAVDRLADYRSSSYAYLARPSARPAFLRVAAPLDAAGRLPDTSLGWRYYAAYLAWQAAEGPAGRNEAYVSLSRGWIIGSDEFKREILADPAIAAETHRWEVHGPEEARKLRWEDALIAALRRVPLEARATSHKSAPWKRAVALHLHETTEASNQWLAEKLDMGSAVYVSKHLGLTRRDRRAAAPWLRELEKVEGKA